MAAEVKKEIQLEIAHVLFIDIVGYSKLVINEQRALLDTLNQIVRGADEFRTAEAAGRLIKIPTGDGMALVFYGSPEEPVECALEISRALKEHSELQLRMGVHSGPVSGVIDVNERANVAGAGINVAQRVMDCGDAGHILLSKHVAEDLEQYAHWRPLLHDLGECEVKHGVRVSVVNLYTEELGNPELPEKFKGAAVAGAGTAPTPSPISKPVFPRWALIGGVVLILGALAIGLFLFQSKRSPTAATTSTAIPAKSIAVLPFANLSANQENAFFTDGVQDEILTHLAKIADLKVISRTSVMQYKTGTERNLREIGKQLGVAHLLEGSVQRAANRVRVNAQLINAQTDAHLWAETFDRDLADVFAIQSEIARTIANQLRAKLSPTEKAEIDQQPTSDLAAFDLYTRGKALIDTNSENTKEDLLHAVDFLTQAVGRDPAFLVAYCQLAHAHDLLYILGLDHTPSRLASGQTAVDAAVRLAPDSGETHLAVASHLYIKLEYDRAREELAVARRTLPNNARTFELNGYINRRQGRWAESARDLEHALELDPSNVSVLQQLALTYDALRAYPAEAGVLERILALTPDDFDARISRAQLEVFWRADTRPLHALIEARLKEDPAAAKKLAQTRLGLSFWERDFTGIEDALAAFGDNTSGPSAMQFSRAYYEGLLARMKGDAAAAHAAFTADRIAQERIVKAQPDYGPAVAVLGRIEAGLGRKEDALREGRRGVELLPVAKDSINGPLMIANLAVIAAWTGEKDLALEQLRIATQLPGGPPYGMLKLGAAWDPLRGDPRFEQIVASLAPKDGSAK
jgi:TolB-like protein/class 3 adenylate cyclase/Flp pilus assembly protein TadD